MLKENTVISEVLILLESLEIKHSNKTPRVDFNPSDGNFEINGLSVPENSIEFYAPILLWLNQYIQHPAIKTTLIIRLSYLNTSSLQTYYEMFSILTEGLPDDAFCVEWYYLKGDVDMKEIGEDFEDALSMGMKIVEVETV